LLAGAGAVYWRASDCRHAGREIGIASANTAPAKEQTPAMAQGITNRVWTVNELLGRF